MKIRYAGREERGGSKGLTNGLKRGMATNGEGTIGQGNKEREIRGGEREAYSPTKQITQKKLQYTITNSMAATVCIRPIYASSPW